MELRMSRKERDRLRIMKPLSEGRLTQVAAGRLLGLSVRQVRRILERYRTGGDTGLVHRARGRPSNHRVPEATVRRALAAAENRASVRSVCRYRPTRSGPGRSGRNV